jgi:hypothetical protein
MKGPSAINRTEHNNDKQPRKWIYEYYQENIEALQAIV